LTRAPELIEEVLPHAIKLDPTLDEAKVTVAITRLHAIWEQLFPVEQARNVKLLVEKVIVSPDDLDTLPNGQITKARHWDTAATPLQLALVRGHRWLAMLEYGEVKSLREIAAWEGVDNSYVSRMVNLTTLAPDIVAAILDDELPDNIILFDLAVDPPVLWEEQRARLDQPGLQS
jgi:hypothetical protein